MQAIHTLAFLAFGMITACSSSSKQSETATPPEAGLDQTPSLSQTNSDCAVVHDGQCYPSQTEACAAASCPDAHCFLLKTHPAKLDCKALPHGAAITAGTPLSLIAEGSAPDDGAGYDILIATAGTSDAPRVRVGGNLSTPKGMCEVPVAPKVPRLILNTLRIPAKGPFPYQLEFKGDGDFQIARAGCDGACPAIVSGRLSVTAFEPGKRLVGSYELQAADGPLLGSIDAAWCGPWTP